MKLTFEDQRKFAEVLVWYAGKKLGMVGGVIEKGKNLVVDMLLYKRGKFARVFLHGGMIFIVAGVLVAAPILASNFPILVPQSARVGITTASSAVLRTEMAETTTEISAKPRDKVEEYPIKEGDTLSSVASNYGVSMDAIKWLNPDIADFETLALGQILKIPPVSGMVHKVEEGDTVYSLAKTYRSNAQKIVDFPFNQFANDETFDLVIGEDLMVPDGIKPEPVYQPPPVEYFAQMGTPAGGGTGQFQWPTTGYLSQYFSWYHSGLDIADPSAPPILAVESGRVVLVEYLQWGYGYHVIIDHGNGYQTLYGHMQEIYVSTEPGKDMVARGQAIGRMGSTGRSTGTHLHFEVRLNGGFQDPLGYLK